MDKLVPLIRTAAAYAAKLNPVPLLDMIESAYGRKARMVVMLLLLLAAVVLGYSLTGAMGWAGVQP